MTIEKLIRNAGMVLIGLGILAGIFGWTSVDFESYKLAKEVNEELITNEVAEASYQAAKTIFISEISFVITSALGCLIGGLVLIGLGRMLENQADILKALNK